MELQQKLGSSCERQVLVCGCHYVRGILNLRMVAEAINHGHDVMVAAPGDGKGTAGTNRPAAEKALPAAGAERTGAELALTLPHPKQATNTVTTSPRMLYRQRRAPACTACGRCFRGWRGGDGGA